MVCLMGSDRSRRRECCSAGVSTICRYQKLVDIAGEGIAPAFKQCANRQRTTCCANGPRTRRDICRRNLNAVLV
jgi:hypothetical protein